MSDYEKPVIEVKLAERTDIVTLSTVSDPYDFSAKRFGTADSDFDSMK